jgi:hypothetical protein
VRYDLTSAEHALGGLGRRRRFAGGGARPRAAERGGGIGRRIARYTTQRGQPAVIARRNCATGAQAQPTPRQIR